MRRFKILLLGFVLVSVMLLVFSGCEKYPVGNQPTQNPTAEPGYIDKDFITKNLTVGTTQDQVNKWFGEKYAIVFNGATSKKEWRYDIADHGYEFVPSNGLGDTAHADLEGLKEGKVKMHLFIGWTEDNKVESYVLYYNAGNKKIEMLNLLPDGKLHQLDV